MYRINYGNGQVLGGFSSLKRVTDAFKAQCEWDRRNGQSSGHIRIERYVESDIWERIYPR